MSLDSGTQTTLLDLNWFYDIVKSTWSNLLDLDFSQHLLFDYKKNKKIIFYFFIIKQEMLWQKYENLLELSVKWLVIQSSLASLISLGQTTCSVWKVKISPRFYPFREMAWFSMTSQTSKVNPLALDVHEKVTNT